MKNKYKTFKRQLNWFKSKINQSDFWNYFKIEYDDVNKEMFNIVFNKLYRNYKPLFKKSTHVKYYFAGAKKNEYYTFSWSFENLNFNRVNEHKAHRLVFRITKNINSKTRTLYRYYVTLNNFFDNEK